MAKKLRSLKRKISRSRRVRAEARADSLLEEAVAINDLRRALNITQDQLAEMLDVKQGAISQMEKQSDMYVSTLKRIVRAMGGKLELVAKFPNRTSVKISQFD